MQQREPLGCKTSAHAPDELTARWLCRTVHFTDEELPMKQLSLTQVRAKLGKVVVEVEKGKHPIAITQGSKIKAVLVSAEWYSRVNEELAPHRRTVNESRFKLRGSMTLTGDINRALTEIRKERDKSFERLISGLK